MATNHIYTDAELLQELIERNEKRLSESAAIGRSYSIRANILSALRNAAWMVQIQDGKIVPAIKKPERDLMPGLFAAHIKAKEIASECLRILDGCRRKEDSPIRDPIDPWDRVVRVPDHSPKTLVLIPHPGRVSDAADEFEKAGPPGMACEWGDLKPWEGRAMAFCAGYVLATKDFSKP
jgi:hypothetical protein